MKGLALLAVVFIMVFGIQTVTLSASSSLDISKDAAFYEHIEKITPQLSAGDRPNPIVTEQQLVENIQSILDYVESDDQIKTTMGNKSYKDFIAVLNETLTNPPVTQETYSATSQSTYSFTEIPFDAVINTNTIWEEEIHLNGRVYVDGAMLVIKPGTVIYNDPNSGIVVRNGGVIIADGLSDSPITFTADFPFLTTEYDFAITIEETALPACKINHCIISNASKGIHIQNIELDNPITNSTFDRCYDGIVQYGPNLTGIYNNLLTANTDDGIEISLAGPSYPADPNGASSTTEIKIEYNLVNDASYGITILGVSDANDAGLAVMTNNCVTSCSEYAVYQSGWMATIRLANGYYANSQIGNPELETLPVYLDDDPFVNGVENGPYYIVQDCDMVDAAYTYDEVSYLISEESIAGSTLIGKTTSETGAYDSGVADIGYHYQGWHAVVTMDPELAADMTGDDFVNFADYCILADNWLGTYDPNALADPNDPIQFADINEDWSVDGSDLIIFASQWLFTKGDPYPGIDITFNQSVNNMSKEVELDIDVSDPNVYRLVILLDGEKIDEADPYDTEGKPIIYTQNFMNGVHELRVATVHANGSIEWSAPEIISFNNGLSLVTSDDGFTPGEDYCMYALGTGDYFAALDDIINEDPNVFTQECYGGVNLSVPANIFTGEFGMYELRISESVGASAPQTFESSGASVMGTSDFSEIITREFDISDYQEGCGLRAIASIGSKSMEETQRKCWEAFVKLCVQKHYKVMLLRYSDCTWKNLKHLLSLSTVWAWHHSAHGNDQLPFQPQRTCVTINGGKLFSFLNKDYSGYPILSPRYENSPSVAELGFANSVKMKFTRINACESAKYYDFAGEMGVFSESNEDSYPLGDQTFLGWNDKVPERDIKPGRPFYIEDRQYKAWEEDLFKYLRDYTLKRSIELAIDVDNENRAVISEKIGRWGGYQSWFFRRQQ